MAATSADAVDAASAAVHLYILLYCRTLRISTCVCLSAGRNLSE